MIRPDLERIIPSDLINQAQTAANFAAKGERQNLVNFLYNLNPDDLELLTTPIGERFTVDILGMTPNAWEIAKDLTPMAIFRGIAEEDKDKPKS